MNVVVLNKWLLIKFALVAVLCQSPMQMDFVVEGFVPTIQQRVSSSPSSSSFQRQQWHMSSPQQQQQEEEARRLLEKAAEIRKQLADLEGKTIEQVEQEAKDKKELKEKAASATTSTSTLSTDDNTKKERSTDGRFLYVPENSEDQIRQAVAAIERAYKDGKTRQTVRMTLVKDGESIASEAVEEWPGGAKQMYREAGRPLSEDLLKQIRLPNKDEHDHTPIYTMPPQTTAQDIYDFDGSAIITTASENPNTPVVKAMVFPNTDVKYLKELKAITANEDKPALSLLINPFWRNVESWGFNILAPGAKKMAQEVVFDQGYGEETYVLSRFSARGERVVALKVYPYDWQLFAYLEDDNWGIPFETAVRLGSSKEEPTSSMFTELLNARPEFKMSRNMRNLNKLL